MNVIFENHGEIDPLLMTSFGVNVKENENPIGFLERALSTGWLSLLDRDAK